MKTCTRVVLVLSAVATLFFYSCKTAPKKKTPQDDGQSSTRDEDVVKPETDASQDSGKDTSVNTETSEGKDSSGSKGTSDSSSVTDKPKDGNSGAKDAEKDADKEKEAPKEKKRTAKTAEYEELLNKVKEARSKALENGADEVAPDVFKALDNALNDVQKRAKKSDEITEDMTNTLRNLKQAYDTLSLYKDAADKKERIDDKGYAAHSPKDYNEGAGLLSELKDILDNPSALLGKLASGDTAAGEELYNKATQADSDFDAVFKAAAMNERDAALKAKKQADNVKAYVSRKHDYDAAVAEFRSGDKNLSAEEYEDAAACYVNAKKQFSSLYSEVAAVRAASQNLIDKARKNVSQSRTAAAKADIKSPIEEQLEGIEAAGTDLLADDDFSYTETYYVKLDETVGKGGSL